MANIQEFINIHVLLHQCRRLLYYYVHRTLGRQRQPQMAGWNLEPLGERKITQTLYAGIDTRIFQIIIVG